MAAPLGFKTFATGDVLTAADTNGYLMQGVWTFANAAARDAAVTSPQEGNVCYLKDTDAIMTYSGSAWVAVGGTPPFVGVSAYASAPQSRTSSVATVCLLNSENYDTHGFHSTATNTSRLTIPTGYGGKYKVSGYCVFAISGTGSLLLKKNGLNITNGLDSSTVVADTNAGDTAAYLNFTIDIALVAGDYLEMFVLSTAGTGNSNYASILSAIYLGA
jgi:hypothetical protein